jgi:hypothetical protein
VSDNVRNNASFRCQREAELVCCGVMERPPGPNPGSNVAFASLLVSVRL